VYIFNTYLLNIDIDIGIFLGIAHCTDSEDLAIFCLNSQPCV